MNQIAAPRARRRRLRVLAASVIVFAAVLALAWMFRAPLADRAAHVAVAFADLGDEIDFRVAEIDLRRVRLEDLRYGKAGPGAKAAEITFEPAELADGRVRTVRLVEPFALLAETAGGGITATGLPTTDTAAAAPAAAGFPALPDIGRIEIEGARIRVETAAIAADIRADMTLVAAGDGRFRADLDARFTDADGRVARLEAEDAVVYYGADRIALSGRVRLDAADPDAGAYADLDLWTTAGVDAAGPIDVDAIVIAGGGRRGADFAFADVRGRATLGLTADAPPEARVDLQFNDIAAPPAAIDLATIAFEQTRGDVSLALDAVGPDGDLRTTLQTPADRKTVTAETRGEADAALIAALLPEIEAEGRVRFVADTTAPLDEFLADPDFRHLTGQAELIVETPRLSVPGVAPDGFANGQIDIKYRIGAVTLTSPGLFVGGVKLPAAALADLPPDVRRAFEDPAFLRLGYEGLPTTILTGYALPDGGLAVFGKFGLGLANPALALFLEGDGVIATGPDGAIAQLGSDRLTLRLVDARLGLAQVGGQVVLADLEGAGETFKANATLSLSARVEAAGFEIKEADVDLTGPLTLSGTEATLTPAAGGRIGFRGYSGPLLSSRDPVRLTLTEAGARRIVYDRIGDAFDVDLAFQGFKTRGTFIPGADAAAGGAMDLTLGGAAIQANAAESVLTLKDVSAVFRDYDIAIAGGNARIALGRDEAQEGRLAIASIRHLGATPLMRPLSLRLDMKGKGDRLDFQGALIAAGDKARLKMRGEHHLATGRGVARFSLGPVVFAPGVLQPQDFAPTLYRTLIESIGQATTGAEIAWGPNGVTDEHARLEIALDKLSTAEITVENLHTTFELDKVISPRSAGAQRIRIGRLDIGVPLTLGVVDVNLLALDRIDLVIDRFELFGGVISSQRLTIDPTEESFDTTLEVTGIDLASILAFAEFGELTATGRMEGRLPISYRNGELRIHDGLIKTSAGGGRLVYKPRDIDEALKKADRSTRLAIQALANFAYDEISIRINELEGEEMRLDIFIKGKSVDVFGGLPMEFNIVIEGPLRQIIEENVAPPEFDPDVKEQIDRTRQKSDAAPRR